MNKIAVLLTCFNRREKTFESLRSLFKQEVALDVYLVDDGSTDGTSEMVKNHFPEVVLIQGDGSLFWNRGMHLAWSKAAENDYDYYFWLNDDTKLFDHCLRNMLDQSRATGDCAVICGAVQDESSKVFTYGGRTYQYDPIVPNGANQDVFYMNGNIVLVPRNVYQKIGMLDPIFHHDLGDYDYGLRAKKARIPVYTTFDYVAFCERNTSLLSKDRKMGVSLKSRFARLYSPFGYHPGQQFVYTLRHFGIAWAVWVFLRSNFINIVSDRFYQNYIKPSGR